VKKSIPDILTNFFERLLSREFVAWGVACLFLRDKFVSETIWWYCTLAFISARTILKFKELAGSDRADVEDGSKKAGNG
jgi:hypothetical protein